MVKQQFFHGTDVVHHPIKTLPFISMDGHPLPRRSLNVHGVIIHPEQKVTQLKQITQEDSR